MYPVYIVNVKKQEIYEALIILKERPSINRQNEDFSIILNNKIYINKFEFLVYFHYLNEL